MTGEGGGRGVPLLLICVSGSRHTGPGLAQELWPHFAEREFGSGRKLCGKVLKILNQNDGAATENRGASGAVHGEGSGCHSDMGARKPRSDSESW